MKRIIVCIITILILAVFIVGFKGFYNKQLVKFENDNLTYKIFQKGLKNAVDFAIDEQGNYYIAFKDRIQYIDLQGKSYNILTDKKLTIQSLEYNNKKLYYSSGDKVFLYDLKDSKQNIIINTLPNYGDYKESKLKIYKNQLYVTIGTATNSGVVGNDNLWFKDNPFYFDLSPKDITLKGSSFGEEKTGAFVPYKTKNTKGQIIAGHFPGNGTVITYNLETKAIENYAWGIRNVEGIDFNSDGKLIASIGGMENRGLRPIEGDVDYIYEIKKDIWYGWPDYSGGDPVTSPRFRGENKSKVQFILDNHPNSNPPAPIYQHNSVGSLGTLAVDSKGKIENRDCIYFYDKKDNILYALNKGSSLKRICKFDNITNVSQIRIYNNSLILLDTNGGFIYNIHKMSNSLITLDKTVMYYLLFSVIILIIILISKFNFTGNKQ